jgi:predicted MFS family arabinose efflux permease
MAFVSAFVVSVLGGRPLGRWPSVGLCLFGYVLFSVSIMVPLLSSGDQVHSYVAWFLGAWGVLLALLAWLALRGWRGLAQRPHPFLANSV